ncbi:MAG: Hsp33 family molecular chaperone HslO [Gammaproteobacteria bacterium]|nr:Hsp33 family molecular chaperone HslO [Gammaproteobacteria bacterium]
MNHNDQLFRFMLEETPVRGEYVRLGESLRTVLGKQPYPAAVQQVLAEAITAATLLSATLKFDGSLILQIQGGQLLTLLVVQVTSQRTVRGMASWQGEIHDQGFRELVGPAKLTITVEPRHGSERYQSVVSLDADSLTGAFDHYFRQSEQLNTRLWLASTPAAAAGLLLQELPVKGGAEDHDAWERASQLTATVTAPEMLQLDPHTLLYRLYNQEQVRLFEPEPVSFRCSCSLQKIEDMLRGLGYDEAQDILREQGQVSISCSFCNHQYRFDSIDIERLFAASLPPGDLSSTRH